MSCHTPILCLPCSQYYTDYKYKPVRVIAEASTTGHGTNIIAGVGVGLEATALPVLAMSVALISSYWLGNTSGESPFFCWSLSPKFLFFL